MLNQIRRRGEKESVRNDPPMNTDNSWGFSDLCSSVVKNSSPLFQRNRFMKNESTIKFPKIVDQAEWKKASDALLVKEKAATHAAQCAGGRAPAAADGQDG